MSNTLLLLSKDFDTGQFTWGRLKKKEVILHVKQFDRVQYMQDILWTLDSEMSSLHIHSQADL